MSSVYLYLIPSEPKFIPTEVNQEKVKELLDEIYPHHDITFDIAEHVEFIVPGENFESVVCNHCNERLETEHWHELMNNSYEKRFSDLTFLASCCQKKSNLNELIYTAHAGFAKFLITIIDMEEVPSAKELTVLENALEIKLSVILARL